MKRREVLHRGVFSRVTLTCSGSDSRSRSKKETREKSKVEKWVCQTRFGLLRLSVSQSTQSGRPFLTSKYCCLLWSPDTLDVFHKFLAGVSPFKPCTV